jgi:tRNA threonylcarbamoyladenosine biosynthesis protein TsaE
MRGESVKRDLADEAATMALAEQVYAALAGELAGWTILLRGDLGAGKSTFARAFIKAAGHEGAVPSPTYTLVEPYKLVSGYIYHIDLYRISGIEELRYLGWNELDDGVRLVEWPERAPGLEDEADLVVELEYVGASRLARILALSERGSALIQKIN